MNQSSLILTAVGTIAGCALLILGVTMLRGNDAPAGPVAVPPIVEDDHVVGPRDSAVVLVEYFDFECPACGAYAPVVSQLKQEYGDRVAFVSRNFPLAQHVNAVPAALAAEAGANQGKYELMHDLLFARQQEWSGKTSPTPEVFDGYAQELGLDMERYRADVASAETKARIDRDFEQGQQIGVNSTPTFFLNGSKLRNPTSIDAFRQILDAALSEQMPVTSGTVILQ